MDARLATLAANSAATEVRTDMSKMLELCDAALTIARERGITDLAEIMERMRGLAQKGSRHRSPSTKKRSAKRPRKAARARAKGTVTAPAAVQDTAMAQAPPPTRGIIASAHKRQVVPHTAAASAKEAELEEEAKEAEEATVEQRRRKPRAASAAGHEAATTVEVATTSNATTNGEKERTPMSPRVRQILGSTAKGVTGVMKRSAGAPGKEIYKKTRTRGEKMAALAEGGSV